MPSIIFLVIQEYFYVYTHNVAFLNVRMTLDNKKRIFFQAEDGIRDQPRSRGLGDVYKRQVISIVLLSYRFSSVHLATLLRYVVM